MVVTVKTTGIEEFNAAMINLSKQTRKSAYKTAVYAGGQYCKSMKGIFKPGEKKRKLITAPQQKDAWLNSEIIDNKQRLLGIYRGDIKQSATTHHERMLLNEIRKKRILVTGVIKHSKYAIVFKQQGDKKDRLVLTNKKNDKRLRIEQRGLAQKMWGIAEAKIKEKGQTGGKEKTEWVEIEARMEGALSKVSVANTLPYLTNHKPGAHLTALSRTTSAMNGYARRLADQAAKKAQG